MVSYRSLPLGNTWTWQLSIGPVDDCSGDNDDDDDNDDDYDYDDVVCNGDSQDVSYVI